MVQAVGFWVFGRCLKDVDEGFTGFQAGLYGVLVGLYLVGLVFHRLV